MLTDVSTDTDDPPATDAGGTGERAPDMNPILPITPANAQAAGRRLSDRHRPALRRCRFDVTRRRRRGRGEAPRAGRCFPMQQCRMARSEATIEALAHTLIFAFPVDVAIRVTDEGGTSYVDMRSNSRYGLYDFGDNAARITAFLHGPRHADRGARPSPCRRSKGRRSGRLEDATERRVAIGDRPRRAPPDPPDARAPKGRRRRTGAGRCRGRSP